MSAPDLARGVWNPSSHVPPLAAGAVRRTVTVDLIWPNGRNGPLDVELRGRDVVMRDRGEETLDQRSIQLRLDGESRRMRSASASPEIAGFDELIGSVVGAGFRKLLGASPDLRAQRVGSLTASLLDQLPGVSFLAGYTLLLDDPSASQSAATPEHLAARAGICAGWDADGGLVQWVQLKGRSPVPGGPPAPPLDSRGWHDVEPMPPRSLRRSRRIDISPGDQPAAATIEVMFRDVNIDRDGTETVLHEYGIDLAVDADDADGRTVGAIVAEPHVLPWRECAAAAGYATRHAGVPVGELGAWARSTLAASAGCTHLNESLRAVAHVAGLVDLVTAPTPP